MNKKHHSFPIRVYYEDTDAAGIVYYANYLKFTERARTEALRQAGIHQSELLEKQNIGFVVRRCDIEFFKPAKLDDELTIESSLEEMSKVSLTLKQIIKLGDETLVRMQVKIVVIDKKLKLAKLPEFVQIAMRKIF